MTVYEMLKLDLALQIQHMQRAQELMDWATVSHYASLISQTAYKLEDIDGDPEE